MITIQVQKRLESPTGMQDFDFRTHIESGSLTAIFGKSGTGKTCLLAMLAGLLKPDSGLIEVDGQVWFDAEKQINRSPQSRQVGMVFQQDALFPHLSVKQNLDFAAKNNKNEKLLLEIITLTELEGLLNRLPNTLSGGQKQRVALARALVQQPKLLLLDEPLSALDFEMRTKLQELIVSLHQQFKLTTLLVSHDIAEVLRMASSVIELANGKVIQHDATARVLNFATTSAKFRFSGEIVSIHQEDVVYLINVLIAQEIIQIVVDFSEASGLKPGDKVMVGSKAFNPVIYKI